MKQLTFDELIEEMGKCYLNAIKTNILNKKENIFFVLEEHLSKDELDDTVILYINKKHLLPIDQFQNLYQIYCNEARWEMKLILVALEPMVIIGVEVSEKKGNPYGLVNIAFAMAIPDEPYTIEIVE